MNASLYWSGWRNGARPRVLTEDMHQFLQLAGLVFLAVQVVTSLLDTFIRFQWCEVIVPFTGPYRVVWMGLGIIAVYLALTLALSIITPVSDAWNCSGTVTVHPPDQLVSICGPRPKMQLRLTVRVRIDVMGRVFGTLVASPTGLRVARYVGVRKGL